MAANNWLTNRALNIHRIHHRSPPRMWQDGFPLGNGFLGVMLWGDGQPLNLTLDCADLWDARTDDSFWQHPSYTYARLRELIEAKRYAEAEAIFGTKPKANALTPTKISIGRASLELGPALSYDCQLDLDEAVVTGQIRTARADLKLTAFVHKERNVICLRAQSGAQLFSDFVFLPLGDVCQAMAGLCFPPAVVRSEGDRRIFAQQIPEGLAYALVWNAKGPDYYLAIECAADVNAAETKAAATWEWAAQCGFDSLQKSHRKKWRAFWNVSAVFLPEPRMEFFWYYGLYLLASSARRGAMPPGLQGVWAMDGVLPPWRGDYHNDMNVQETFWPAGATGHLDLLDSWCDYMLACQTPGRVHTRKVFGTEGIFWPCVTMGVFKFPAGRNWYALNFSWSHGGWLGWLVWLRWRYSLDTAWLRDIGYPILADIFRFYRANLEEGTDGRLHVPLSNSPEYHGHDARETFCRDPNIDLALIRRCCDWIMEMETALGLQELSADAMRIKERLTPYALTEKGTLCLWPGKTLDESHRHPSHLMAIHPAMDWTTDDDELIRKQIQASVDQYLGLGQYEWAGHTYAQMISFAAVLGRGEWAYDCLRQFADRWVMPNGLHINSDWRKTGASAYHNNKETAPFTMEANCAVCAGISDMLLQGWRDVVRVFPAVPAHWREIAFRDLMTEGTWKVSAVRHLGRPVWVQITAGVTRRLRLQDPFAGEAADVLEGPVVLTNGFYEAALSAGESVTLQRKGYRFNGKDVVSGAGEEDCNKTFQARRSAQTFPANEKKRQGASQLEWRAGTFTARHSHPPAGRFFPLRQKTNRRGKLVCV